jgi:hypothetical protein
MISEKELTDGNNWITELDQTRTSVNSCYFFAKTHNFFIKFKNNTPKKVIMFQSHVSKVNGLNIISFSFPLKAFNDSKIQLKNFYFTLNDDDLAMKGKIFEGIPKKMFLCGQLDKLYIGEMLNEKKEGFGEIKSETIHYLGIFQNNKRTEQGKYFRKILKKSKKNSDDPENQEKQKTPDSDIKGFCVKIGISLQLNQETDENPRNYLLKPHNKQTEPTSKQENQRPISLSEKSLKLTRRYLIENINNIPYLKFLKTKKILLPIFQSWEIFERKSLNPLKFTEDSKKTFIFNNGDIFTGMTRKSTPHGYGIYRYSCGKSYHGEFHKGKRHGLGTLFNGCEKVLQGSWSSNNLNGLVRVFLPFHSLKCIYSEGILVQILSIMNH